MLHEVISALAIVFDPARFAIICSGVVLGLIIGVIPGIGGLAGLALLIPFTYAMDPYTALAFLIGMWAVTATSDTVPAILFGVPGAIGSAATVLDGYPMAKRGEAGRAFGASFSASILGGLFGAVLLGVSIPILQPFMLAIGSPDLLAVCILGLTLIASISQGAVLKGLTVAMIGVLFAAIGNEAQTGTLRWTFDEIYLWDGIQIQALALGLFALPEMIDMAIAQRSLSSGQKIGGLFREQLRGVRDVMQNWKLVINSSMLGVVFGSIPGMGAPIIDWLAYGSAARMLRGATETFGKGDVRGVIAAEAANNSREGGALIPTLAFGLPGSPSMALLLGAFLAHGITPGPKLLTTQLDITFTLVWSLALANVVGAGISFLFAGQLARLATVRWSVLVPIVFAICFVGAFQGSRSYGDLVTLIGFGVVGWFMKRYGWARAPLILGFILGKLIEKYLFISVGRYGFSWLERPLVIVVLSIAVLVLCRPIVVSAYRYWHGGAAAGATIKKPGASDLAPNEKLVAAALWAIAGIGFAIAFWSASAWQFAARLMPQTASIAGFIVVLVYAYTAIFDARRPAIASINAADGTAAGSRAQLVYARLGSQLGWLISLLLAVLVIGMMPALGAFIVLYIRLVGAARWSTALLIAIPLWIAMYLLFNTLLHVPWPPSLLGDAFPQLRAMLAGLI
ncbi:MAG TPA: tripartite tricarboxylate transporter permease [Pseudolabrys sp.]|nr:tripartite tricarboxylate transporter permease [Pseudolabrys sp.]